MDRTPAQYWVSFPPILARLRCPVEGCQGTASSQKNLWVHFSHRHPWDNIVFLEEWNKPYSWFPQCDMFVPQESLNWAHPTSEIFRSGTERKQRRFVVEETEDCMGRVF